MPRMTATAYDKATATEQRAHREAKAAWDAAEVAAFKMTGETGPEKDRVQAEADAAWENLQKTRAALRTARIAALAASN
jgi:hypothetical protein